MLTQILRASQWCYKHKLRTLSSLLDKLNQVVCSADIPGSASIASDVSFPHGGLGVVIHRKAVIGSSCIINAKVTIGNGFPNGGTPQLGKYVYVGANSFVGGGFMSLTL